MAAEADEDNDDGVSASLDSGSNKRSWIRFGSIVYGLPCILSSLSRYVTYESVLSGWLLRCECDVIPESRLLPCPGCPPGCWLEFW